MEHSRAGLGQVIRELRESVAPKLSQEELGRRAGYRAGAGVSMSRIENGVTRPGPRRLEGIATALGVTVRELEARSTGRSTPATVAPSPAAPSGTSTHAPADPPARDTGNNTHPGTDTDTHTDTQPTRERLRRIQAAVERRTTEATSQALAFNAAHDRARDEFFLAFVDTARTIRGVPAPHVPSGAADGDGPAEGVATDPAGEAVLRRRLVADGIASTLRFGAGPTASDGERDPEVAYDAVVAAAILAPPPAAARPEHPAGATARATRALLAGGTPRVGGTGFAAGAVLTGFLASAASPLFAATTLIWLARRTRQQNQQLRLELDRAETNLVETELGFAAVMDLLGRATEHLTYVAVHGGHAQGRWRAQLPSGSRVWTDLSEEHRRQYRAFVEVAACQVSVDTVNMTELLAATGPLQDGLIQVADAILTLARQDLEQLV